MSLVAPTWIERLSNKQKVAVIVTALIAVLILILLILWAFSGSGKKEGELIGNIGEANGQNAVIANVIRNQNEVVKNAEEKSNEAGNALNLSINRPSNQFDGNRANDRYCRNFPEDCR